MTIIASFFFLFYIANFCFNESASVTRLDNFFMDCTFTCNWFHNYRSECVASPCLAEGSSCEAAGAPPGSECATWCCVYEPVRGLIFLPVAIAVVFLLCVLGRCTYRWVIVRRRKQRAARIKLEEEYQESDDDAFEEDSGRKVDGSHPGFEWHEPTNPTGRMHAPTARNLVYPLDRSTSPAAAKDLSSISPPPEKSRSPELGFEYIDEDEDSFRRAPSGSRKPWYA